MYECRNCGNNGVIVAVPKDKQLRYQYGFRCSCPVGRAKSCVGIPLWNSRHAQTLEISHVLLIPADEPEKAEECADESLF
jgi:hypothetical protein